MEKEILNKLIENGEVIHRDYFGTIQLEEHKYLVYWVAQGYIDEFSVTNDDDTVKVLINIATVKDGKVEIPESVMDYIPTPYRHIKRNERIQEIDEIADDLRKNTKES